MNCIPQPTRSNDVKWWHRTHVHVWTFEAGISMKILTHCKTVYIISTTRSKNNNHVISTLISPCLTWFGVSSPSSHCCCLPQAQGCCWTSQGYHPVVQSHQLPNLRIPGIPVSTGGFVSNPQYFISLFQTAIFCGGCKASAKDLWAHLFGVAENMTHMTHSLALAAKLSWKGFKTFHALQISNQSDRPRSQKLAVEHINVDLQC